MDFWCGGKMDMLTVMLDEEDEEEEEEEEEEEKRMEKEKKVEFIGSKADHMTEKINKEIVL
jgi:hypothetical protein